MTRRDLLDDNVDLLARAARLIDQRPSFQLSVKPVDGEGASKIVVSAVSKVPASKRARAISRLDVYVNGRPVRSIDAEHGTVPPTQVVVESGRSTRGAVEAQAWGHGGALVCVGRTSVS